MSDFQYRTREELLPIVGSVLEFETWSNMSKQGELVMLDNKLWLPFCGYVNALTVRIKINPNE